MSAARDIARRLLSMTNLGRHVRGIPGSDGAVRNALRPAPHLALRLLPCDFEGGWGGTGRAMCCARFSSLDRDLFPVPHG
jgi:hypothetical protein